MAGYHPGRPKGREVDRPDWAPSDIDIERPSAARMYDYYLGGSHNFAADRAAAAAMLAVIPDVPVGAQANRAFLRRAVRHLTAAGMRQFLDIGSGIPTLGNVHEIAQQAAPDSRVVYVDIDPVAVAHSEHILAGNPNAAVIQEDLRRPKSILEHDDVRRLIDFSQPVALMLVAVMHFISEEDDPASILTTLREATVPGSYLVMSHGTAESRPHEAAGGTAVYQRTSSPLTLRDRQQLRTLFDGYELVDPGVVFVPLWHPDSPDEIGDHPELTAMIGGVGRRV
jgi:hypothetical protein